MKLPKIDLRQPKYIFPIVLAVPLIGVIYFLSNAFTSIHTEEEPTDRINMTLPEPNVKSEYDKLRSMESRYSSGDAYSAVDGFGTESTGKESIDNEYSEEELRKLVEEAERKQNEERAIKEMEAQQRQRASNTYPRATRHSNDSYESDIQSQLDAIERRTQARMKALAGDDGESADHLQAETERLAREEEMKREENAPHEVVKVSELMTSGFNTVSSSVSRATDEPLIKAMIDRTTKTTDGTRLRFKLLDDVSVKGVTLPKGTYLYGTVSGFSSQRVKARISNIMVGSQFIKVDLSVFDIDGMEGFYVPESSFREFMTDAASGVAGQNISITNGTTGDGFNAQNFALQALQNIYQAGSNAISKNLKKNKAKIKYNTIVYLINSQNVR